MLLSVQILAVTICLGGFRVRTGITGGTAMICIMLVLKVSWYSVFIFARQVSNCMLYWLTSCSTQRVSWVNKKSWNLKYHYPLQVSMMPAPRSYPQNITKVRFQINLYFWKSESRYVTIIEIFRLRQESVFESGHRRWIWLNWPVRLTAGQLYQLFNWAKLKHIWYGQGPLWHCETIIRTILSGVSLIPTVPMLDIVRGD